MLASAVVNFSFRPLEKAVQPSDFGLGPSTLQRSSSKAVNLSDAEIADQWRGFYRGLGMVPKSEENANANGS